jgi:hypothetical protein
MPAARACQGSSWAHAYGTVRYGTLCGTVLCPAAAMAAHVAHSVARRAAYPTLSCMTRSASVEPPFRNVAPFDIFPKFYTHLKTQTVPKNGTRRCCLYVFTLNEVSILLYTLLAF